MTKRTSNDKRSETDNMRKKEGMTVQVPTIIIEMLESNKKTSTQSKEEMKNIIAVQTGITTG